MGYIRPFNLLSWKVLLICIGLIHLVKHDFKRFGGYVMILIGGVFILNDITDIQINTKFIWPVLIILFGVSIIYKNLTRGKKKDRTVFLDEEVDISDEEFLESNAIFGAVDKSIVSKDFKGAKVNSYFGGTELNLTKADIVKSATIETNTVFGGTSIIVPSGWEIRSEITSIFGGVEDKRPVVDMDSETGKVLVLRGNCVFGGIEIQSYI
jgi:predicted membrane protein